MTLMLLHKYVCTCVIYKHLCNAQCFRFVAIKGIINYTIARHMTIDFRKKPGTRKDCHLNW